MLQKSSTLNTLSIIKSHRDSFYNQPIVGELDLVKSALCADWEAQWPVAGAAQTDAGVIACLLFTLVWKLSVKLRTNKNCETTCQLLSGLNADDQLTSVI